MYNLLLYSIYSLWFFTLLTESEFVYMNGGVYAYSISVHLLLCLQIYVQIYTIVQRGALLILHSVITLKRYSA